MATTRRSTLHYRKRVVARATNATPLKIANEPPQRELFCNAINFRYQIFTPKYETPLMLLRTPASLHRAALYVAHRLRLGWWAWRKPEVHGCNAIVFNAGGEVLLVRHSYQAPGRWMLPGGGMGRRESAEVAAIRELKEEVGCRMDDAECFWVDIVDIYGAKNHVHLVIGRSDDLPVADEREIIAAAFYPLDALPELTALSARARIERWRNRANLGSVGQA